MILCRYHHHWYLAHRGAGSQTCSLSVGALMPREEGFIHVNQGFGKQLTSIGEVTFYPTLKLLGCQVWPRGWKEDSADPILHCMMGNWWISLAEPPEVIAERKRKLDDLGFRGDIRDGLFGLIHVDELEKIEGPPPEGLF